MHQNPHGGARRGVADIYLCIYSRPTTETSGHIAVHCNDVYKVSVDLEENGVQFQKKPDEGRMKGLAFALDPD